jgi:hypothetical protein
MGSWLSRFATNSLFATNRPFHFFTRDFGQSIEDLVKNQQPHNPDFKEQTLTSRSRLTASQFLIGCD